MPLNKRASSASGMHKISAAGSAAALRPDALTRAAIPLRIAEVRQPRALGSPAPCRKAEPCSSTTVYNINWINWLVIGSGVDPWRYPFRGRPVPFTEARRRRCLRCRSAERSSRPAAWAASDAIADETSIRARSGNRKTKQKPHVRSGGLKR